MIKDRGLTEMEGAVLGLIWDLAPCTPYAIRKVFQQSPNPFWSGSAGAIYPLVRRLERRGLVSAKQEATGRRARAEYSLTNVGLRALHQWVGPPLEGWAATIPVDPLRLRVRFLSALDPSRRVLFLSEAERQIASEVRDARAQCDEHAGDRDRSAYLVARGVLRMARARLAWVREVRSDVAG